MDLQIQEVFTEIVSNGAFGKNLKFVLFEQNKDLVGKDQFKSEVIFGTINLSDGTNYSVLVKFKIQDKKNKNLHYDLEFHNELIIYEQFIPYLFECCGSITNNINWPSLPKFFYGRNQSEEFGKKDLILLENANSLGYYLTKERLFLDYNHLVKALESLAK